MLLDKVEKPLSPTVFVKLMFLLRHETILEKDATFYDFVPYRFGPFSFGLYRELANLRQYGYVIPEENRIALSESAMVLTEECIREIPQTIREAISCILQQYAGLKQNDLIRSVYTRYPWFAVSSELPERHMASIKGKPKAKLAVYTTGYEGKSIDAFFDHLMRQGIKTVIDVRANPISRKYGFSRHGLNDICVKLEIDYHHVPSLGIPSSARANLSTFTSYQRLLNKYDQIELPKHVEEVAMVGSIMHKKPSVLVCVEKDFHYCHRSRLAEAVARVTGLKVVHL
ncbi:MAG: DUF488 family protein [bacterium]|nr:DUF488 family protein [bacterium]